MIPFIVAELSANHLQDYERAVRLVEAAAESGADAVKLQCWDRLVIAERRIESGPWAGRGMAELYAECKTPWSWFKPLFSRAKSLDMVGFSSAFDWESVEFLVNEGCPILKIASAEITDHNLIAVAAKTGLPLMMSTGMADEDEIDAALMVAKSAGCDDLTLLHCTSAYPAPAGDCNLLAMADLDGRYGVDVGLSDHTLGWTAAAAATALNATVIEKHLTLARADGGPDAGFSAEPHEFAAMVKACREVSEMLGDGRRGPRPSEMPTLPLRRGLWVTQPIRRGERLTPLNLRAYRPATTIPAHLLTAYWGRVASRDLQPGDALTDADAV